MGLNEIDRAALVKLSDYNAAFLATQEEIMEYRPKVDTFITDIKNLIGEI